MLLKNGFPHAVRKAKRAAARRGRRLRILFADEARFGRINRPRPCWAPIGIRPEVASQSDHAEIGYGVLPGLPQRPVTKVCQAGPLGSRRRPQPSLQRPPASKQYLAALPAPLLARAQPEEKSL